MTKMTAEEALVVLDDCIEELSGYRPLTDHPRLGGLIHARAAVAELIAERNALQRAVERKDYCMVNVRARLDPAKSELSIEELAEAIAYRGTP